MHIDATRVQNGYVVIKSQSNYVSFPRHSNIGETYKSRNGCKEFAHFLHLSFLKLSLFYLSFSVYETCVSSHE